MATKNLNSAQKAGSAKSAVKKSAAPAKKIFLYGSTGSIGTQTVDIIKKNPDSYKALLLSAGSNSRILGKQVRDLKPKHFHLNNEKKADHFYGGFKDLRGVKAISGNLDLEKQLEITLRAAPDLTVNAVSGMAGLSFTLSSLQANVDVALANKESIVIAHELIQKILKRSKARLIPVDSEPNAIFQCLVGEDISSVKNLWITASGGPFRGYSAARLKRVTVHQALQHPRWSMGPKITIDSSTLMNKGLEVIEASRLFNLPPEKIKVVVHPQSIIHSMVEFTDGTFKAVLSETDMRFAIAYALSYPERGPAPAKTLDLKDWSKFTFEEPDNKNFPALGLAFDALKAGGSYPAAYCVANEIAVEAFIAEKLSFTNITRATQKVIDKHVSRRINNMDELNELIMDVSRSTRSVLAELSI